VLGDLVEAMIGREHDQGLVEPDRLVDELEQVGERGVEPQHALLRLEAVRAEGVENVVVGREADRQHVGRLALADLLLPHELLSEIEGQLVAHRHVPESAVEVGGLLCAELVRKGPAQMLVRPLRGPIIGLAENVPGLVAHELPGRVHVAVGVLGLVPFGHPGGIGVVVVGAGHELAAARGVPERLAETAARQDRAAILHRDREHARAPAARQDQLVAIGRGGEIARGRALVRLRLLADDRVTVVLDAVDLASAVIVPVVAGQAVLGAVAAGEQGGVADRREGRGVLVVGVVVDDAVLHQVTEAAGTETVGEPERDVAAQAVDRERQDQLRLLGGPGGLDARRGKDADRSRERHGQLLSHEHCLPLSSSTGALTIARNTKRLN
jgi:hypothetical protein